MSSEGEHQHGRRESTWWPNKWFKDETFWRDVTTRALAGLIVVTMTAIVGVASGLLNDPRYTEIMWRLIALVVFLALWVPASRWWLRKGWRRTQKAKDNKTAQRIVNFYAIVSTSVLLLGIFAMMAIRISL